MWDMKSVYFNKNVALRDLDRMTPASVFKAWLDRIREYYVSESKLSDQHENGFASMVLQLCAVDALASFVEPARSVLAEMSEDRINPPQGAELKIRTFLHLMLERNEIHKASNNKYVQKISTSELLEATAHLYFQYRCGLVHNGFTVQVGEYAGKNSPGRLFLMSYQTDGALCRSYVSESTSAFIVNPNHFRSMLTYEIGVVEKLPTETKEQIGSKIQSDLSSEIEIAKQLPVHANYKPHFKLRKV